jgi:imidazolonepropionase-like amidohydrolase
MRLGRTNGKWSRCRAVEAVAFGVALGITPLATAGQQGPVVVTADRLIVGDGSTIESPVVVVDGDRIVAVGSAGSVSVPRAARTIDLSGHTLLPGLIDTHTHINSSDSDGGDMAVLREHGAHGAIYGVVNALKTLDAGFTTIRNAGALHYADVALRDLISRGVVPGPRLYVAAASLGITGGHSDVNGWSPLIDIPGTGMVVDGADDLRKAVRTLVKFGADHIKIVATGGILSAGDAVSAPQYSDEELRAVVQEAGRLGRKVMAHAHGAEGMNAALRAGVASIEHGSLIDEEGIRLMKQNGAYLVPTLIILDEIVEFGEERGIPEYSITKAIEMSDARRVALRRAFQEGVLFAFGTDASGTIHGRNAQEFRAMVEQLGATPMEAIVTATSNAADLIGIGSDAGTVQVGKWADVIAVPDDPLEDITALERVDFVMKAGRVHRSPTHQSR